jgi:Cu(I)/Ag(I) efflux system membrane fusion protein
MNTNDNDIERRASHGDAPPRFTKTMGVVRWAIFGAVTAFALIMVLSHFGATPWASRDAGTVQYHCPMHPTYVVDQKGDCPICGMSLVPVKPGSAREAQPQEQAAEPARSENAAAYTCPMHPEVVSDKEGRCPECGMFLVPAKAEAEAAPGASRPGHEAGTGDEGPRDAVTQTHADHSAVPGLVPVTLEPRRVQMIGVRTGRVERRPMDTDVRLAGYVTVDETRTAEVNVRTSGWVEALHVDQTGQAVSRGAPLLSLYSQDLYAAGQDLLTALASYNKSTADPTLAAARRSILDAARERLRLLGMSPEDIAGLEADGESRPELTLRSPFSGVVLEKNVVDGQYVMPEQALFRIADLGTVWVLADVYERDIASVRVGAPARMSVDAFPGEVFDGKITFVYPSVSEMTRTLKVRFEFPNPSLRLRPGMYAQVELLVKGPETIAVPSEAVMDGGKTQYAFVVRDRATFEPRLVTTGRRFDGWVEVLSGLDVGEEIVTSANFLIDSESRLQAAIAGMGGAGEAREKGAAPKSEPPVHTH